MSPRAAGGPPRPAAPGTSREVPSLRTPKVGEVHLWHVDLDRPEGEVADLARTLVPDERDRAARFRSPRDRRRFVVGRGLLRAFIGRYLGVPAASLTFRYGPAGKPALEWTGGAPDLRFNLAHCRGSGLFAFSVGRDVGVDLEAIRPVPEMREVARTVFSARERRDLQAVCDVRRPHAFFRAWTRKEAVLKALGRGLDANVDRTEVTWAPGVGPVVRAIAGDPRDAGRWTLIDVDVGADHAAALAVEGGRPQVFGRA